jgi:hypothetical protein
MKEARHVKKQQSSQRNKTQSTREKGRKKNLHLEWKLPSEAEEKTLCAIYGEEA